LRVVGPAEAVLRLVVVLGDGAHWIWDLAAEQFGPERTEIVDYYHATEHVWTVARALYGDSSEPADTWAEAWCVDLLEHGPQPFLTALRTLEPPTLPQTRPKSCGPSWATSAPMLPAWTIQPSGRRDCRSAPVPSSQPPSTLYKSE